MDPILFWIFFVPALLVISLYAQMQNGRDDLLKSIPTLTLSELVGILTRPNLQKTDHELWHAAILSALPLYRETTNREEQSAFELAVGHTVEARALEVINAVQSGEMARVRLLA